METNRLRQLKVLVETQHLRKAAEILGISHAGLHKSLRQLEVDLKRPLFRSAGKRIEITDEGMALYHQIPPLLAVLDGVMNPHEVPSLPLRIGTHEAFSTYFLATLLETEFFRGQRLKVLGLLPGEIEDKIAQRQIDLGITYTPIPTAGVDYQRISFVRMGVFARVDVFPNVSAEKIPFVIPARPLKGTPNDVSGLDGWPENLFSREVFYEADLMESALEIVRQGCCAIFIPEFIARLHNKKHRSEYRLVERPLPAKFPAVKRPVFLVRALGREEGRAEKVIAKCIRCLSTFQDKSS